MDRSSLVRFCPRFDDLVVMKESVCITVAVFSLLDDEYRVVLEGDDGDLCCAFFVLLGTNALNDVNAQLDEMQNISVRDNDRVFIVLMCSPYIMNQSDEQHWSGEMCFGLRSM